MKVKEENEKVGLKLNIMDYVGEGEGGKIWETKKIKSVTVPPFPHLFAIK